MKFSRLEITLTVFLVISVAANVLLYWSANKTYEVLNEITSSAIIVNTAKSIERQQNALAAIEKGNLSGARANIEQDIKLKTMGLQAYLQNPDIPESISGLARWHLHKLQTNVPIATTESKRERL